MQDTENVYTRCKFRAIRISEGLHKRWKTLRNVYTKDAYLETKFTQEVRKHEKKVYFFANNVYTVYQKKAEKFTLSTLV